MSKKHDQIHIFIDESGSHQDLKDKPIMVGGLVVLGNYGAAEDDFLNKTLSRLVLQHNGRGLGDLHDRDSATRLDFTSLDSLRRELNGVFQDWSGSEREARGVALIHKADVFDERSWIIAEGVLDNRYINMVWALIEHVLFVDPWVETVLDQNAKIHLYVANRVVFFQDNEITSDYLKSIGQNFRLERGFGGDMQIAVPSSINAADLRTSFRMALREKWPKRAYDLSTVEVKSINYRDNSSLSRAGLYLSDLHLRAVRGKIHKHRTNYFVKELFCLDYNETFIKVALLKSRMEQGNQEGCQELAADILNAMEKSPALASCLWEMKKDLQKVLEARQDRFEELLLQACRMVDEPGKAESGLLLCKTAWDLLGETRKSAPANKARWVQVRLSHANHTANRGAADIIWEQFTIIEPKLAGLGWEGLVFRLNLRNRRSVSLMDQFRFKEAESTLISQIAPLQVIRDAIALQGGMEAQKTPLFELGAAFGTLGQILAMQGPDRHAEAEGFFNRAIGCFVEPRDIERQLVYLGHLACDMGEKGRGIWNKVSEKLLGPDPVTPVTVADKQFVLAIQAKGLFQFGGAEDLVEFARKFKDADLEQSFGTGAKDLHPFGLIWQDVALCAQKAFREKPDGNDWLLEFALDCFDQSISFAMAKKQPLFDILGHLAAIRKKILLMDFAPEPRLEKEMDTHIEEVIHSSLKAGLLTNEPDGSFSGAGSVIANRKYNSVREKATALLGLLHFNYW